MLNALITLAEEQAKKDAGEPFSDAIITYCQVILRNYTPSAPKDFAFLSHPERRES